jgi:HlyD family secretion protein
MNHCSRKAVALASVLAAFLVASCTQGNNASQGQRGNWNREQRIPAVEAVEVVLGTLPLEERLAGSVRARNQTEIYAEVAGQIVEVLVNDGDRVGAGDPLVRLRDNDYRERVRQAESGLAVAQARVQQAQANLTRAEANLRRLESLAERNLVSRADLESAQAETLSAEADLALMRAQLDQADSQVAERRQELAETIVRAPVSGVVGGRNAELGQITSSNTALFVIGDTEDMLVEITLTQRMLGYIRAGTTVNIVNDASPDEVIEARIARISPFLHPVTRTTRAEIEVARSEDVLRPGMFVTVDVLYGETEVAPIIPNSAIYRHPRDGRTGVYAVSLEDAAPDRERPSDDPLSEGPLQPVGPVPVRFVPVELVARGRLTTAVRGVEPGEWVVTLGHHLLESSGTGQALIQPTPWDHIIRLQQMQTRDLLDIIRRRQEAMVSEREIESLN